MVIAITPCLCDPNEDRINFIRESYLNTINSILYIFDKWTAEQVANDEIRFLLGKHTAEIFIKSSILVKKRDRKRDSTSISPWDGFETTYISFPLIVGTQLWTASYWGGAAYTADTSVESWTMDCPFCQTHIGAVPTTIFVNGSVLFQQVYAVIDARRPHAFNENKGKRGKSMLAHSKCYVDGKLESLTDENGHFYSSRNPIFTSHGSLATQRLFPITATYVTKLSQLLSFVRNGTLSRQQAQLDSEKIINGDINNIFSKRGGYQSHIDFEESGQSRLVAAFEKNNSRYQQLKCTSLHRIQFPITIFKLIAKTSHNVLSNRLFHDCEEGFLSIGFVTEGDNTGQQSTAVLGIGFSTEMTFPTILKIIREYIKEHNCERKTIRLLWGNNMSIHKIQFPKSTHHQFYLLAMLHCDFTVYNDELFYIASFSYTPMTTLLFTNFQFSCITVDYLRRYLRLDLHLPNLGLLEFISPCLNSSHPPKVMQSLYHLKQAIDANNIKASTKECAKQYHDDVTMPPIGSSILNVPTVPVSCSYRLHGHNDEDGVVVSEELAKKLRSINTKTVAVIMVGCQQVHQVCKPDFPLYAGEVLLQIRAERVTLSNSYLKSRGSNGVWTITFNREYSERAMFIKTIEHDQRIVTIIFQSFHHTSIGDKLTSLHGQKCTIAKIDSDETADMVISPTCLKRLPVGELIYGHLVSLYMEQKATLMDTYMCFGYEWLFMDRPTKSAFLQRIMSSPISSLCLFVMRLTQEAENVLSYANIDSVVRDKWVGQNVKGLINTGASAFTLPGLESLEHMGLTSAEYLIRLGTEDPAAFTKVGGRVLSKTAHQTLLVLSQFNNFNISFID